MERAACCRAREKGERSGRVVQNDERARAQGACTRGRAAREGSRRKANLRGEGDVRIAARGASRMSGYQPLRGDDPEEQRAMNSATIVPTGHEAAKKDARKKRLTTTKMDSPVWYVLKACLIYVLVLSDVYINSAVNSSSFDSAVGMQLGSFWPFLFLVYVSALGRLVTLRCGANLAHFRFVPSYSSQRPGEPTALRLPDAVPHHVQHVPHSDWPAECRAR